MGRKESDSLGELEIEEGALYGIHSWRARQNFPNTQPFHREWYQAIGLVKKACYLCYGQLLQQARSEYHIEDLQFPIIEESLQNALIASSDEVARGLHFDHFIVPGISGGAGTSINMNVNEIIANRAQQLLARPAQVDPIEMSNIFQSTNDVIPTSLKICLIQLFRGLEEEVNQQRQLIEDKERTYRDYLRMGHTQLQEAVPSSFGKLLGSYQKAISRDWWRISKCFERLKQVNLGGSAIGTGIAVPRYFIFEVAAILRTLTGLPITRAEELQDATMNLDMLVETHAIIKSHAVNLEKMVSDLRLLASDLCRHRQVILPAVQVGSSIMPGKINPVIPEYVISCAHRVYSNDSLIASLSAQGQLDLNAYIPLIGHAFIESLKLLISCNQTLTRNLWPGLRILSLEECDGQQTPLSAGLEFSPTIATALIPWIGYHRAAEVANLMKQQRLSIYQAAEQLQILSQEQLTQILRAQELLKLGYTLTETLKK